MLKLRGRQAVPLQSACAAPHELTGEGQIPRRQAGQITFGSPENRHREPGGDNFRVPRHPGLLRRDGTQSAAIIGRRGLVRWLFIGRNRVRVVGA